MKILLTGRNGQLGWELERALAPLGEVHACDRQSLDLADPDRIVALVRELKPALIVNPAAYTAVDKAESEPDAAYAANARAPGILAEEARRLDALLVHYSTDYVFDGTKTSPYTEADATHPLGVYGASKLAGEQAIAAVGGRHWVFRTSWVYAPRGKNFLLTMLRLAREGKPLRVVADQYGAPTSAAMLARATVQAVALAFPEAAGAMNPRPTPTDPVRRGFTAPPSGIYHMTAAGRTSWHGFAEAIMRACGLPNTVAPNPSSDYPLPAKRPANSVLDNTRLQTAFGIHMPTWEDGLREAIAALA